MEETKKNSCFTALLDTNPIHYHCKLQSFASVPDGEPIHYHGKLQSFAAPPSGMFTWTYLRVLFGTGSNGPCEHSPDSGLIHFRGKLRNESNMGRSEISESLEDDPLTRVLPPLQEASGRVPYKGMRLFPLTFLPLFVECCLTRRSDGNVSLNFPEFDPQMTKTAFPCLGQDIPSYPSSLELPENPSVLTKTY